MIFYAHHFARAAKRQYIEIKNNLRGGPWVEKIEMPFVSQVFYNDDHMTDFGCEEAAILNVWQYYSGNFYTPDQSYDEMKKMVGIEKTLYGREPEMGLKKTAEVAKKMYNLDSQIVPLNNLNDIKAFIDDKQPVIVPAIAKDLHNYFYSEQGYHMIVVVGYTKTGFIVHDPGTGSGANYYYPFENVMQAALDIEENNKQILILSGGK